MESINTMAVGYDTTFEMNEFNEPRIRSEIETVKNIILFVLFSKPGTMPSLPHVGINIQSLLYSFYDEINVNDLKNKIIEQCNALGCFFNNGSIGILKTIYQGQPSLLIHIEGTETYPEGYMKDSNNNADRYLIGITFDECKKMIYNVSKEGG